MKTREIKIKRKNNVSGSSYWEFFDVTEEAGMTVVSALKKIAKRPKNRDGQAVAPVVWDCNCLEEICGACTMLINGKAKQACSTFIKNLPDPIVLEPLSKFPVLRDLKVDRSALFKDLDHVYDYQHVDSFDLKAYSLERDTNQNSLRAQLGECIYCGSCLEACPQYNTASNYLGALAVAQTYRLNLAQNGHIDKMNRMETLLSDRGVIGCQNVGNCELACPKKIPLKNALGTLKRDSMKTFLSKIL
ncbi:MAG: succinate dehydrogenase iron-sulfur subunit [bacterium]|nr:succinate dehydrogenase iron-sulfur subunit [bacterium]MBU1918851.1 succinate dehydrogenase iron-sulfur subunit [bacterium]